ncbi:MAG TPA: Crp/Fnr family transcriptional regulator [Candidatus Acidoferrales bacterium]|nr:Crp/Fnr family transcriptional regulator [Candidatus Acidoferrales bacterium]
MATRELQVIRSGERTNATGKAVSNKILLSIPNREYSSVRPHLNFVDLLNHHNLYEPGQTLKHVHFLNKGMISLVVPTEDGKTVEAGVVGHEGMAGMAATVGLMRSPLREIVQVSGDGFRVTTTAFQGALASSPKFRTALNRYAVLQGLQVAQTAACNRLHEIEQRLARWLLMVQDRIDEGKLLVTHDFLATMLGTDRPSVTVAAGTLQKRGLIEYTRAAVKIVNRKKLESFVCECYGIIQQFNGELGLR